MKRTTISLPDAVAAALEREAARRRIPVSQVAREAIEARLGLAGSGPRELPFVGIAESHDGWTAAGADDYLAANWARDVESDGAAGGR